MVPGLGLPLFVWGKTVHNIAILTVWFYSSYDGYFRFLTMLRISWRSNYSTPNIIILDAVNKI